MAYVINLYGFNRNVEYVQWQNQEMTILEIYTTSSGEFPELNIIPAIDPEDWQRIQDEFLNGLVLRPYKEYEYWGWDDVNNEWIVDYDLFNPMLIETMKKWRKEKLGLVMNVDGVYFANNPEERTTMLRLSEDLKSRGVDASVNWKGSPLQPNKRIKYLEDGYTLNPNYDPNHADAQYNWTMAKWEDFQNAGTEGHLVEQNAFSTEKYITVTVHGTTPYSDLVTPVSDADDYFDNL